MLAARSPGRLRPLPAQAFAWPYMAPLKRIFSSAQGSIHRALPFQEWVSSRIV